MNSSLCPCSLKNTTLGLRENKDLLLLVQIMRQDGGDLCPLQAPSRRRRIRRLRHQDSGCPRLVTCSRRSSSSAGELAAELSPGSKASASPRQPESTTQLSVGTEGKFALVHSTEEDEVVSAYLSYSRALRRRSVPPQIRRLAHLPGRG